MTARDDAGRPAQWETTVESEWSEYEQGLMVALAQWEDRLCPVCGGDPDQCQSPEADRSNPLGKLLYQPDLPLECHVGTAARLAKVNPDEKRALIPRVKLVGRKPRRRRRRRT